MLVAGATVKLTVRLALMDSLVTVASKVLVPTVVGVPVIVPFGASVSPPGSPVAVQVYVPFPPEACKFAE